MYVADKTIRVSEDTWRKLRARKRGDESFEAVIERELEDDDPLAGLARGVIRRSLSLCARSSGRWTKISKLGHEGPRQQLLC